MNTKALIYPSEVNGITNFVIGGMDQESENIHEVMHAADNLLNKSGAVIKRYNEESVVTETIPVGKGKYTPNMNRVLKNKINQKS